MRKSDTACILLVHPSADLYGSDRVFLESVSGLVATGKRVVVALPTDGPLTDQLSARGAQVEFCITPVLRKSMLKPTGLLRLVRETVLGLKTGSALIRREQPDVVYASTVTVPLWNVLAKVHRIPLVCHVHEGEASASRLIRSALALPLFLAGTIIANSRFSVGVLGSSFGALARRSLVLYNAVPSPADAHPARNALTSPVRLTYIGRLSPRKGVDVAIDAVALLSDRGILASLDLVGDVFPGYEWYEAQLRDQVNDNDLNGRVHFRGFQPSIWEIMAAGDIVVVPSRGDEPFGNTAVEAILGGRPVVASATTGLLEATAGYRSAYTVEPNDPAALADAVEFLVAEWGVATAASAADRELARSRHSPSVYRAKISEIVDLMLLEH